MGWLKGMYTDEQTVRPDPVGNGVHQTIRPRNGNGGGQRNQRER